MPRRENTTRERPGSTVKIKERSKPKKTAHPRRRKLRAAARSGWSKHALKTRDMRRMKTETPKPQSTIAWATKSPRLRGAPDSPDPAILLARIRVLRSK